MGGWVAATPLEGRAPGYFARRLASTRPLGRETTPRHETSPGEDEEGSDVGPSRGWVYQRAVTVELRSYCGRGGLSDVRTDDMKQPPEPGRHPGADAEKGSSLE